MVLENWLTAVFTAEPDEENTMAFNLYNQSKDFDIRVILNDSTPDHLR